MLDNPKKTEPLMAALKAAVPFDVELMPALIKRLQTENIATLNETSSNRLGRVLCRR